MKLISKLALATLLVLPTLSLSSIYKPASTLSAQSSAYGAAQQNYAAHTVGPAIRSLGWSSLSF